MSKARKLATMPDIASQAKAQVAGKLDWVGMNHIEMPLILEAGGQHPVQASSWFDNCEQNSKTYFTFCDASVKIFISTAYN